MQLTTDERRPGFLQKAAARFFETTCKQPRTKVVRYLLPLLAIASALLIHLAISKLLAKGTDFPYAFLYLIAIFAVAWFGGYGPGAVASLLLMVGFPAGAAAAGGRWSKVDLSRLTFMIAVSLGVSGMAHAQRRRRDSLHRANDELDQRVRSRTRDLDFAVDSLKAEIVQRKWTEKKLQDQLARLNLLSQITSAIGERQDLKSIFQAAICHLEDSLPIDFGCVCLHDPGSKTLAVHCVGGRSEALAADLSISDNADIGIDQNGLSQCMHGNLVYEADISRAEFPFLRQLFQGGLHSLVAAPLLVESQVFGILVAARRPSNAFSSSECEFLRQLSEHVALAAHQAQVNTALQQAYDDLRQTQQTVMRDERLRALGQMASGIAHDINNAISPVSLYTELLLESEQNLSPRTRTYLETTQRAISDVAHTVARMREFYRQPEAELIHTPVNLNSMVQQVLDLTRARWSDMAQQRGSVIQLRKELAPDLPAIPGIESEIREALINLVFNAVDAMPDGGILTIRTGTAASATGQVDIEVTDTGVGMDEETRRRCLEPFFTTKGERGTGLGLAMVFGVAQRHNSEITIDSVAGEGTTVRLCFPVSAPANAGSAQPEVADTIPSSLRILVVDDDPLVAKTLRKTLEHDGHAVVTAAGGQEGIDIFRAAVGRNEPFALVITDLGMPYIDGGKVACAVKQESPSAPVILLTGWGQRLLADGELPPNVDRVLSKPPKLRDLRAALMELTAGSNLNASEVVPAATFPEPPARTRRDRDLRPEESPVFAQLA